MNNGKRLSVILVSLATLWSLLALPAHAFAGNADDTSPLLKESSKPQRPKSSVLALPVVEIPAKAENDTVTLFYSGDGGWRDLDRTIGQEMAKEGYPVVGIDCLRGFWKRKTPEQAAKDLTKALEYYRHNWGAKRFVLAGYSFGADILPPIYNRLSPNDRDSIALLVLLAFSREADFEIHVAGFLGKKSKGLPLSPELARLPTSKLYCVYGKDEKDESGCSDLADTEAEILELPGGHHFDQDYPKLTRLILDKYRRAGLAKRP